VYEKGKRDTLKEGGSAPQDSPIEPAEAVVIPGLEDLAKGQPFLSIHRWYQANPLQNPLSWCAAGRMNTWSKGMEQKSHDTFARLHTGLKAFVALLII